MIKGFGAIESKMKKSDATEICENGDGIVLITFSDGSEFEIVGNFEIKKLNDEVL